MKLSEWILKISGNSESMLRKIANAGDRAQRRFTRAGDKIEQFSRGIRYQAIRGERSLRRLGTRIGSLFSPLNGLKSLALTAFSGFAILSAAQGITKFGGEAQKARVAYEVMLGSVERGNAMYDRLQEFANVTPFDNRNVDRAAQTLLQFGVAGEDILPTLQMIGDVSAGDAQKLSSLTLAFGQMSAAGKLMGQDLLQMINAGFNPLQTIAEQTGQTMGQLRDEMAKGAISSEMVKEAFKVATGEGGKFNGMMDKMSQTFSGRWSTAMGKMQLLAIAVFERIEPALMSLMEVGITAIDALINNIDVLTPIFYGLGSAIAVVAGGMLIMKAHMIGSLLVMKLVTAAQWLWNLALTANPIGIVVVAIGALVGWLVYLYQTSEKTRGFLWGLWEGFKSVFTNMRRMAFDVLGGIGEMLIGVFTFDKKKILSGFERLKGGFTEFGKKVADDFNRGFDEGVADLAADKAAKAGEKKKSFDELFGKSSTGGGGGSGAFSGSAKVDKGLQGVSGGGKSIRNVTFTVNKMFETFNVNSQNIQEGARDVGEMVKKEILRGLRGAEQAAVN